MGLKTMRWSVGVLACAALVLLCLAGSSMAAQEPDSTPAPAAAQSNAQSATPLSVLTSAVAALTSGAGSHDARLQGTAHSIGSSSEEVDSSPASILCSVNGYAQLRMQMQRENTPRSEMSQRNNGVRSGHWTGRDGNDHAMAYHNLMAGEHWFCPVTLLSRLLTETNVSVQFAGMEPVNGQSLEHFLVTRPAPGDPASSTTRLLTHLTEMNIYLDPQTLRPAMLRFNTHPDNTANIDIPVEIRYENYIQGSGIWHPSRIEKYVNNGLSLVLDIGSAEFNQGSNDPLLQSN